MEFILKHKLNEETGKYICCECSKEYTKNGIGTHYWRTHGKGKGFTANNVGRIAWNKGLTKNEVHSLACSEETKRKISVANKGFKHSEHTKKKISESMKVAHFEGRAHNIGMCRWNNEMSYPEKFFSKVIENEFDDKQYTNEYPVSIYSIDFAWVEKKLAIEIDGHQHEKSEYKERDVRKDKLLKSKGWKVLRIKWKDMFNDPKIYIQIAKDFVNNN